jgi:hypothetical protein
MLQLIGPIALLIANLLLVPLSTQIVGPFGVSGGGPVGRPIPRPAATIFQEPPSVTH